MDYAGGSAGLTGSHADTCPVCGWIGPGRDAPFHECVDYRSELAFGIAPAASPEPAGRCELLEPEDDDGSERDA